MNERLSEALASAATGLSSLEATTKQGRFIEGLNPKKVDAYSSAIRTYLKLVKAGLRNEGVSSLIGSNIRIAKIFYEHYKVKLFLPADEEKSVVIRVEYYDQSKSAKDNLQNFLDRRFPTPGWNFGYQVSEHFAERELVAEDIIPKDEPGFDRNSLLEGFVFGLDERIKVARQRSAINETGEYNDTGLEKRISAFQRANQILTEALIPSK